jgi:hypothetical protein
LVTARRVDVRQDDAGERRSADDEAGGFDEITTGSRRDNRRFIHGSYRLPGHAEVSTSERWT